jgi:multiple sugar transport system permease protein
LFVDGGIISTLLSKVGLSILWLNDPLYEIITVAIVDMWRAIGFHFLLLFAALKGIPQEYYDAAKVDGANDFQQIIYITIPQLEPVLFLVVVNAFIGGLQSFDLPWLLSVSQGNSYGGVGYGMLFPVMTIYVRAWQGLAFGEAAAYAVILGVIVLAITGIQFAWRAWRLAR